MISPSYPFSLRTSAA